MARRLQARLTVQSVYSVFGLKGRRQMEAQKPTPAQEANVSAGTGSNQGLGASVSTGELDLSAIQGGLFGGHVRLGKRMVVVTGMVAVTMAAGWIGYRFCAPPPQESSPAPRKVMVAATTQPVDEVLPSAGAGTGESPAASWTGAQRAYAAKEYQQALEQYRQLAAMTASAPGRAVVHELFLLRAADCLQKIGTSQDYRQQLSLVGEASSPLVFSLANYRLAALDCQQELWLQGLVRAYRALAAGGLTGPAEPLQAECQFLIARSLTQQILKLTGVSVEVAWSEKDMPDPISLWDERELIQTIIQGGESMSTAALGPRFEKQPSGGGGANWRVQCWRSPLEQVISRFAHASGANVEWSSVAPAVRQRPVTLLGETMNQRRLLEMAAGAVGLLARSDGATVRMYDLAGCDSVAQQQQLLADEASSTWTKLVLAGGEGSRAAEGQFALGILRECTGDQSGAVPELRQVALRFPSSRVAPYALMRSARINMALRDYVSAQDDLTNLMNMYPEHPGMEKVFLLLAKACAESSRPAEAAALFKKVYLLDRSTETKASAALAAGMNCHKIGAHADAVQWLERFLAVVRPSGHAEIPAAYLMSARSRLAMGDVDQAVRALYQCLANRPAIDTEREALIELARAQGRNENFVGAMIACNRAAEKSPTPADRDAIVVLQAELHRKMGLPDKAVSSLQKHLTGRGEDPKAVGLWLELARCCRDGGAEEEAYRLLNDLLARVKNGQDAERVKCELAELSVKLQKGKQAIVLMEDVLKTTQDAAVRRRCYQTLAAAHVAEKDFERAASIMATNVGAGGTGGSK